MSSVFPRSGADLPIVARAAGAIIWDADGKRYIDACGGAIVVNVGHGDAAIVEALATQARAVSYAHATQFKSEALETYATEVAALLPLDDARVYPVSGGSEAVETALKMARAFHLARGNNERYKVIAREGSYHGNTLGALDASGRKRLRGPYEPWLGRFSHVPAPYEYRCTLDSHPEACGARHAEILDDAIRAEGAETVAAFIAEPVVGAALGAVVPPRDYWTPVAEVCRRHGVLLIADEVMTGFGRTGAWFACEHWGLRPDILTAGKGASSGYWPFGFTACSGEVYEAIASTGFTHGYTFSHSVVGAAVGSAVLLRLRDLGLVEASRSKGEHLVKLLTDALSSHPHVGDVRGLGLLVAVELVADRSTKKPFDRKHRVTETIIAAAKESGLLLYPSIGGADGTNGDALLLGPPFVIGEEELDEVVDRLGETLASASLPST